MMSPPHSASSRFARSQLSVALVGVLALVCLFGYLAHSAPSAPILFADASAPWLSEDHPAHAASFAARHGRDPEVVFERSVAVEDLPTAIEIRALREFVVELDGRELIRSQDPNWKQWSRIELAGLGSPPPETATLTVRVRNPLGPGLLQVRTPDGRGGHSGVSLSDVSGWQVTTPRNGTSPAVVADDTRRDPRTLATPRSVDAWIARGAELLIFAAVFAAASFGLRRPEASGLRPRLVRVAPWLLALVWLGLLAKAFQLPTHMGFDGPAHLAYVHYLIDHGALPLATDGAVMYHPPLFYGASAALIGVVGRELEWVALGVVPFASGVALVLLAIALARVVSPRDRSQDRWRIWLAAACAGLLPMNLYMASYLSNEGLHAALAACSIWLIARQLVAERIDRKQLALAGAVLGAAVLTKATSLVLLPIVGFFVAFKGRGIDREGWGGALALPALFFASCAGVCGWFFARNQWLLGQALIGNWNIPGSDYSWWQYPGFHTAFYYTQFGDALTRPFFSAVHSFPDGLYSTFWGDGLIGGIARWGDRHEFWSYDYMAIAFGLALPATLLGMLGFARLVAASFAGPDLRRRTTLYFLMTTLVAFAAVLLMLSWLHPAYGMNKSFYALAVTGPLALCGAEGLISADRWLAARGSWARVAYHAWACTLAVVIVLAFLA